MKRTLIQSPAFIRAAKRLAKRRPAALEAIRDALSLIEADAFHPQLRTHKLKGDMADCWSSSAGYDLRIVHQFVEHDGKQAILLLTIGTHDEVY